jgi:hypothetical protein
VRKKKFPDKQNEQNSKMGGSSLWKWLFTGFIWSGLFCIIEKKLVIAKGRERD